MDVSVWLGGCVGVEGVSGIWEVDETLAVVVAEVLWCAVVDEGVTDVGGVA